MKVKINKQGQVTIPWLLRQALWAKPGDELEIEMLKPGRLEIRHTVRHDPFTETPPWDADWLKPLPSPAVPPSSEKKSGV